MTATMVGREHVYKVLSRLMKGGVIERMPKKSSDAKLLLALAATSLLPREPYSEEAINEHLINWLDGIACPIGLDFVTVRRYMVDYGYLIRDASGSIYTMNSAVTAAALDDEARAIDPREVFEEMQKEREHRRSRHTSKAS